jgi:hypothetical protein
MCHWRPCATATYATSQTYRSGATVADDGALGVRVLGIKLAKKKR